MPYPAARTRITQMREYPPPLPGTVTDSESTFCAFTKISLCLAAFISCFFLYYWSNSCVPMLDVLILVFCGI